MTKPRRSKPKNDLPRYAWKIRELRQRCSLTQAELAGKLGVRANTVARWERAVRDPYIWNYWSLQDLSAYRNEWDLAEFFNGQIELVEQRTKWERAQLLRNLAAVRARAADGDALALRLLQGSEKDRTVYLREKLDEIKTAWSDAEFYKEVPERYWNPAAQGGSPTAAESEQYEAYYLKKGHRMVETIREIEAVDLLREGYELESLEAEAAELKRRLRQRVQGVVKRFELLRSQRIKAREILKARLAIDREAPEEEFDKAYENLAEALGLDPELDPGLEHGLGGKGEKEE
jgi:DNA-binding XRE family transcriptional regulator